VRIAVNASFLSEWIGGLANYSISVIDYLCQCGEEAIVYVPDCVKLNGHKPARRRATPASLRSSAGGVGSTLRALVWCQTALPLRALRDRVDVLFSTVAEGMLMPVCPQVVVVHDLMPLFYSEEYPRWRHYFRHALPRLLNSCQRVIADSVHTRQDLIRELGVTEEKIEVVYPWVDPLFVSDDPGSPPEGYKPEPHFLFIGASIPRKNLETVVRALARIKDKVPHSLVCVLGLGHETKERYLAQMLDLANELGVRQRMLVLSNLTQREILFLYRHATALVMLSQYEGFGYPPLESMAVGTPAIVSDSTSLGEVSGPAGIAVPCMDVKAAADAMLRVATDSEYRRGLSEAGVLHAARFSREETGRQILSVLRRSAARA
jgi:glycosyltransferase involved in cell wall biosynthesis